MGYNEGMKDPIKNWHYYPRLQKLYLVIEPQKSLTGKTDPKKFKRYLVAEGKAAAKSFKLLKKSLPLNWGYCLEVKGGKDCDGFDCDKLLDKIEIREQF